MKNYFVFLCFLCGLLSCQNEPKDSAGSTGQVEQPAALAPETEQPAQPASTAQASARKQDAEPVVGSIPAFEPPRSQDQLTIIARDGQARPGADLCVPIQVKGFVNLIAMQYTLAWDAKVLEFKGVDKPGLPYLDQADFGFNRVKEGLLPFVWINDALQSTTISDGSTIYEVCFKAIGASGQSSAIRFIEQPTPFEVVNINEEIEQLNPVAGKVVVE
ncbi:MAG: hypothetical protein H6573_30595 [Lewinellaceae bacterium]|nr:hypothetical protein [Phaeodactylibacter sp.]MCB9351809.1 hypothetical protein [Lewinellaceae bacterium]